MLAIILLMHIFLLRSLIGENFTDTIRYDKLKNGSYRAPIQGGRYIGRALLQAQVFDYKRDLSTDTLYIYKETKAVK